MRSGLASRVAPMQVSGRPQDPDVRFSAPTAAATEMRSAPTGGHPGRRVRRCGTLMRSLRRPGRSGKGSSFSRDRSGPAAGWRGGFDTKSGSVPILREPRCHRPHRRRPCKHRRAGRRLFRRWPALRLTGELGANPLDLLPFQREGIPAPDRI